MSEKKLCKKCLLSDIDKDGYFKSLAEYIANIDPKIKSKPAEYERRLNICRECDDLLEGMCRKCGCYVELRAAIDRNVCPGNTDRWKGQAQ